LRSKSSTIYSIENQTELSCKVISICDLPSAGCFFYKLTASSSSTFAPIARSKQLWPIVGPLEQFFFNFALHTLKSMKKSKFFENFTLFSSTILSPPPLRCKVSCQVRRLFPDPWGIAFPVFVPCGLRRQARNLYRAQGFTPKITQQGKTDSISQQSKKYTENSDRNEGQPQYNHIRIVKDLRNNC